MTGPMTWADFVVIGLTLLSGLLAMLRGFVREVLGIGAWAGAFAFTVWAAPMVRPTIAGWISDENFVDPVTYASLFLVSLIVFLIISNTISGLIGRSPLGGINRLLGLFFGLARGAALVVLVYLLADKIIPAQHWPLSVAQAQTLPLVERGASWVVTVLPEKYRPDLEAEKQLSKLGGTGLGTVQPDPAPVQTPAPAPAPATPPGGLAK